MIKGFVSMVLLIITNGLHAEERISAFQNGIYYIQDNVNPQVNEQSEFVLSYRPESINEVYFEVQDNTINIYYYRSDNNWVLGQARSSYNVKAKNIVVKEIVEIEHAPNEHAVIKIGDKLNGKQILQAKKEIIPISKVTNDSFTISCDEYVKINNIPAFDFPENYIISPEGGYCNRAYDDSGDLTHFEVRVKKIK